MVGFSLDDLLKNGAISKAPSLIKIDVDGIEHLILSGAKNTLANDSLKSIFIEVNDDFEEQSVSVKRLLESAGFTLKKTAIRYDEGEFAIWKILQPNLG